MSQLIDEPLQDHINMSQSAGDLCTSRNKAALSLTNARSKHENKNREIEQSKAQGARESKLQQLDQEADVCQAELTTAQNRIDKFSENLASELKYFHGTRATDMRSILASYADAAFMLASNIAKKWGLLFKKLQS